MMDAVSVGPYVGRLTPDVLLQCFGCIKQLDVRGSGVEVLGVLDAHGEAVKFEQSVVLRWVGFEMGWDVTGDEFLEWLSYCCVWFVLY